ncbi:MAG: hypothetical protein WBV82_16200 [Myxococcaceae bacterium]
MRNRRWPWLMAALVLLGAGAWLMSREDPERPEPARERVSMPRKMRNPERQRAQERRTLVVPAPDPTPGEAPPPPPALRDPVLAALPSKIERAAVVIEANALRHSPVGELLVDCMTSFDGGRRLQQVRDETGVDPLEDLDRVAFADGTLILSGHFENAELPKLLFEGPGRPHGRDGMLHEGKNAVVGSWRGQMFVLGNTAEEVTEVLDRLEGKGLGEGPPLLDESSTFGEIYGVISPQALARLVPKEQQALAQRLERAAERIELHVDAQRNVGIVADIGGGDPQDTVDLGKSVGAALALARMQAQANGKTELAELLEFARVVPENGEFRMEMSLPLEVLEKHLKECVAQNEARKPEP